MADLEKVIKGLETCLRENIEGYKCETCPYLKDTGCVKKNKMDALKLLKSLQPKIGQWFRTGIQNAYGGTEIVCSVCDDHVIVQNVDDEIFCRHCGAKNGKAPDDDE